MLWNIIQFFQTCAEKVFLLICQRLREKYLFTKWSHILIQNSLWVFSIPFTFCFKISFGPKVNGLVKMSIFFTLLFWIFSSPLLQFTLFSPVLECFYSLRWCLTVKHVDLDHCPARTTRRWLSVPPSSVNGLLDSCQPCLDGCCAFQWWHQSSCLPAKLAPKQLSTAGQCVLPPNQTSKPNVP